MSTETVKHNKKEALLQFYQSISECLSKPVPEQAALPATTLYEEHDPPTLMIYIGPCSVTHMRDIRRQLPAYALLFYLTPPAESEDVLQAVQVFSEEGHNVIAGLDDALLIEKMSILIGALSEKKIRFVVARGFGDRYPDQIQALQKAVRDSLENLQQERSRGLVRLRCSVHNLPSIIGNSDVHLNMGIEQRQAVICGAGPSLLTQLEALKKIGNKALLIATGHAFATLIEAGIDPDMVVEVDSYAERNWPEIIRTKAVLAACTEVSPSITRHFEKIVWCAGSAPAFTTGLEQWGITLFQPQMAKSVTVPAIDIAIRLGCTEIALVGQDLCVSSSGVSHADGMRGHEADITVELPGNDGGHVKSTPNFQSLRDALQEFLVVVNQTAGNVSVLNCTEGGALIDGTERQSFNEFCSNLTESPQIMSAVVKKEQEPFDPAKLETLERLIREYMMVCKNIWDSCKKLQRLLEDQPVDMQKVRMQQRVLQQLVTNEDKKRKHPELGIWLNAPIQHVDHILKETPGVTTSEADARKQIRFLQIRFAFIHDLCEDIRQSVVYASKGLQGESPDFEVSPFVFRSFRRRAITMLSDMNPELSEYLRKNDHLHPDKHFDVRWVNQFLPYIEYKRDGDTIVPLSGFITMFDEAETAVQQFVEQNRYDNHKHGVVFVGAGNWTVIAEFARLFPDARVIVLDPWLELFSTMIDRGCFLHLLPPESVVIMADSRLPGWQNVYTQSLKRWTDDGVRPLYYIHPKKRDIEDLTQLVRDIPET